VCALLTSFVAPVFADEYDDKWSRGVDKLGRGIINVVSATLEIPKQIDAEWKEGENAAGSIIGGFFKGLVYTVTRVVSGVYDIVTCPINIPQNYEPLVKPEFVFGSE